jgi:hypothetical protein
MRRPRLVSTLVSAALALGVVAARAEAEDDDAGDKGVLGLGLIIGEPTGISGKYYLADDTAVDAAVGGALIGGGLQIHADYLWHPWILERKTDFVLPAYFGIGARVLAQTGGERDDHVALGARVPVGILFDFTSIPLDVFVEVAGVLDYRTKGDAFGLDLNAGGGARYYF